MMVNGKPLDVERLAVDLAKQGQRVRLETIDGSLVLEPGTGNIHSVALPSIKGVEIGWIAFDEDTNTP